MTFNVEGATRVLSTISFDFGNKVQEIIILKFIKIVKYHFYVHFSECLCVIRLK